MNPSADKSHPITATLLLSFLLLLVASLNSSISYAQAPTFSELQPPVDSAIDKNGVNLSTGNFQFPELDLSIGDEISGLGLKWNESSHNLANSIVFTWYPKTGNGDYGAGLLAMHASLNGKVYRFMVGGGTTKATSSISSGAVSFREKNGPEELVCSGNAEQFFVDNYCILHLNDGTFAQYLMKGTFIYTSGPITERRFNISYADLVARPDGEVIRFIGSTYALTAASSLGWMLKMNGWAYVSNAASIVGINTAQDYCDPNAASCAVSSAPQLTSYKTSATEGGTDTVLLKNGVELIRYNLSLQSSGEILYTFKYLSGLKKYVTLRKLYDYRLSSYVTRVYSVRIDNSIWTYEYNANQQSSSSDDHFKTVVTNPDGTTKEVHTTAHGIKYIRYENGSAVAYSYNTYQGPNEGRLEFITFSGAPRIDYVYDSRNNIIKITKTPYDGGAALVTSIEYPATCSNRKICNKPHKITEPNGVITDYSYHPEHGGIATVTKYNDTGAIETRYSYIKLAPAIKSSSGSLVAQSEVWRLEKISQCMTGFYGECVGSADERVTAYTYKPNNLLLESITVKQGDGARALTTTNSYDAYGRKVGVDGPIPGVYDKIYSFYDALGRFEGTISQDPDGSGPNPRPATRIRYDADGRTYKVDEGVAAGTSRSGFDSMAVHSYNTTEYSAANGLPIVERRYSNSVLTTLIQKNYNSMLRLQCEARRLNPSVYSSVTSSTSACSLGLKGADGNDRINRYYYANDGKLERLVEGYGSSISRNAFYKVFHTNGTVDYEFDGNGNKTDYTYDGFNRLEKTCYPYATSGSTTNPSDCNITNYNTNDSVESVELRDLKKINFYYDNLGRVKRKSGSVNESFSYNNFDQLTAHFNNGVTEASTYYAVGWLHTHTQPMGTVTYSYDSYGRKSRLTYPDAFYVNYEYNNADQPTSITTSNGSASFTFDYDNYGKRAHLYRSNNVTTTYGRDEQFRLGAIAHGSINNITLSYTPANQLKSKLNSHGSFDYDPSPSALESFVNDHLNRISSIAGVTVAHDGRGNIVSDTKGASYNYDAKNLLKSSTKSGVTTYLNYDASDRLLGITKGDLTTKFLYDGKKLIAEYNASGTLLRRYIHGPGEDEPLLWYEGAGFSNTFFFIADQQGSIVATVNNSGAILNINRYDAYGNKTSTNSAYESRFSYTGQTYLKELGLYYFKARIYHPMLGRFLQTDPIGYGDGLNWYVYAHGDPVNGRDPSGLASDSCNNQDYSGCNDITSTEDDQKALAKIESSEQLKSDNSNYDFRGTDAKPDEYSEADLIDEAINTVVNSPDGRIFIRMELKEEKGRYIQKQGNTISNDDFKAVYEVKSPNEVNIKVLEGGYGVKNLTLTSSTDGKIKVQGVPFRYQMFVKKTYE